MANSLAVGSQAVAGLGTFVNTIVTAGMYTVEVKTTLPASSGVQIVLKQNASTLITVGGTTDDPTPTQQSIGAMTSVNAAAGDTISVVLSSANAVDSIPNAVKSVVNLFQGFGG